MMNVPEFIARKIFYVVERNADSETLHKACLFSEHQKG